MKAEQCVKLARLQDGQADFRLSTGQLTPKFTTAELELAAKMKVCWCQLFEFAECRSLNSLFDMYDAHMARISRLVGLAPRHDASCLFGFSHSACHYSVISYTTYILGLCWLAGACERG